MNRYMHILFSVVFVGLVALAFQVSASSITEESGAIGPYCSATGTGSFAGGNGIKVIGNRTFAWGSGQYTVFNCLMDDAFLIFPAGTAGMVGIGTESPERIMHIKGINPRILIEASSSNAEVNFKNSEDSSSVIWSMYKDASNHNFNFYQGGNKVTIQGTTGNVGIGTANPTKKLTVRGNLLLQSAADGTDILELGEGLDYAEGFDVVDEDKVLPGCVLIIDSDNPGKLKLSELPYDTRVAGISAGAKGLGSGVRLGVGQFDRDVALAGRVYCNVDSNYGEINPGDLLTTSPTPGYAMVVSDSTKAQGAILGKAMQRMERGQKKQMLVLVTLQ